MGLLDNLFGDDDGPKVTLETTAPDETYIRAELEGTRSLCGWDYSPDGEWLGLYTCSNPRRVALVHGEEGQFMRKLDRPSEIAVADGGRVAVTDDNDPDADGGTLAVFDPDGTAALEREYGDNLGDCALSTDGQFVAAVTAPDAVGLLDVDTGDQLARADSPVEYPELAFDDAHGVPVVALFADEDGEPVETIPVETT